LGTHWEFYGERVGNSLGIEGMFSAFYFYTL
jgi:hypothetical protein